MMTPGVCYPLRDTRDWHVEYERQRLPSRNTLLVVTLVEGGDPAGLCQQETMSDRGEWTDEERNDRVHYLVRRAILNHPHICETHLGRLVQRCREGR